MLKLNTENAAEATEATVSTADGKQYIFTLLSDPPVARIIAAKQFELQAELMIDSLVLKTNLNSISQLIQKGETIKAAQVAESTLARIDLMTDIVPTKLALACVMWTLPHENPKTLDTTLTAKKIEIMSSSSEAIGFFLDMLQIHFSNYMQHFTPDILLALHHRKIMLKALSNEGKEKS